MCGEMGKAVLSALTTAVLCGFVSHAAYLQRYEPYEHYEQAVIRKPLREHEKPQDLRNVPGTPGVDYPIYHEVPETRFSCSHVPVHPGMYANVETGCQAYHVCHDGREGHQGASFLCTNGTLFDQAKFACDWWYNVDCSQAIAHYKLNADPLKNPYVPKPKPEEHDIHQHQAPLHQVSHHQAPLHQVSHHQAPLHQAQRHRVHQAHHESHDFLPQEHGLFYNHYRN